MHCTRALKQVLAPGAQDVARAVEYHHRMSLAVEHMDRDAADIGEGPTLRQFARPGSIRKVNPQGYRI